MAAWLRLSLTHGIGPATALTLLRAFGTPDRLLGASHAAVAAVIGNAFATRLLRPDPEVDCQVRAALQWAQAPGHHLLSLDEPAYPVRLLDLPDPPPVLYVDGDVDCLGAPTLAIVGSRHATLGGLDNARAFAQTLVGCGLVIASGLARGIDTAAHEGALAGASRSGSPAPGMATTIAVLGTGIDRIYPAVNHGLARRIPAAGALICELPLGSLPARGNFPRRNRLLAALSLGVLVVEASDRSGSLITARLAADLGREVFAIPGSIHSPQSRGCHRLIRDGAQLVETADDVLSELRLPLRCNGVRPGAVAEGPVPGSPADRLLHAIGHDFVSVDSLSSMLGMDGPFVELQLLQLELDGRIERLADGRIRQRTPDF